MLSKHLFECYKSFCRSSYGDLSTPTASEENEFINLDEHDRHEQLRLPAACEKPDKAQKLVHSAPEQIRQYQRSASLSGDQSLTKAEEVMPAVRCVEEATLDVCMKGLEQQKNTSGSDDKDARRFHTGEEGENKMVDDAILLEKLVPWDHGLTTKEKRKKEKQLRLDRLWDDRLTQEKIDETIAAAEAAPSEPEVLVNPEPEALPDAGQAPLQELKAWDEGLSPKNKRKKQKTMQSDGTWNNRLTQEQIDEIIATAIAQAEEEAREPGTIPGVEVEPEPEPAEGKRPWDEDLNVKRKKKEAQQMELGGTWQTHLTQETIDEEIAATATATQSEPEPEPELELKPIVGLEPEPEPAPEVAVEKHNPWDHGLFSQAEKRRREANMKAANTWEDRLTRKMITAEAESAEEAAVTATADLAVELATEFEPEELPPPPVEAEPRFPWGDGLAFQEKKKSEKEKGMKLNRTWNDKLSREKIDGDEAVAVAIEPESEPVLVEEEKDDDVWSFASLSTTTSDGRKKEKGAEKSAFADPVVEETVADPETVLEPGQEPALVIEHVWTRAVARPEEWRESLSALESAEEMVRCSPCIERRRHLQEISQWLACSMCMEEVASMGRKAALV